MKIAAWTRKTAPGNVSSVDVYTIVNRGEANRGTAASRLARREYIFPKSDLLTHFESIERITIAAKADRNPKQAPRNRTQPFQARLMTTKLTTFEQVAKIPMVAS